MSYNEVCYEQLIFLIIRRESKPVMPIPQVRKQQLRNGAISVNRRAVRLDSSLEDAREGVLAMLGLGELNPNDSGVMISFRQNSTLAPEQYQIAANETGVLVEAGDRAAAVYAAATIAQL